MDPSRSKIWFSSLGHKHQPTWESLVPRPDVASGSVAPTRIPFLVLRASEEDRAHDFSPTPSFAPILDDGARQARLHIRATRGAAEPSDSRSALWGLSHPIERQAAARTPGEMGLPSRGRTWKTSFLVLVGHNAGLPPTEGVVCTLTSVHRVTGWSPQRDAVYPPACRALGE